MPKPTFLPLSFPTQPALVLLVLGSLAVPNIYGAAHYRMLESFGQPTTAGASPAAAVFQGTDSVLYGTTASGGLTGNGTIFKVTTNGVNYTVLHHFGITSADGLDPQGRVIQASDGALYGTTHAGGGTSSRGTVFSIGTDGTGYRILHQFLTGIPGEGLLPNAGLIEGIDGTLYGTTTFGGSNNCGTLYKLNKDGTGYVVLHSFTSTGGDGQNPYSELIEGPDTALYGTTYYGGASSGGTVFKINRDGTGYIILRSFSGGPADGRYPSVGLIVGSDGALYGTTAAGGTASVGTAFRMNTDGTAFSILHAFGAASGDGQDPEASVVQGSDGFLYGTTYQGGARSIGTLYKISKDGTNYSVLHSFASGEGDLPMGPFVQGATGELFATASSGGAFGAGTMFKTSTDGSGFAVLWAFSGSGTDGIAPKAGVLEASDQRLYGTTQRGGSANLGTVFRMDTDGSGYSVLYGFGLTNGDGGNPTAGLVEATNGFLYGTTRSGGTSNLGTIYRINKDGGSYAVLHSFSGSPLDGGSPYAGLISGGDGYLYGTTLVGGFSNVGTVFKVSTDGSSYSVLVNFGQNSTDGASPYASVMEASDGFLYGATYAGGTNNHGTIFRLGKDGSSYSVLHSFMTYPAVDGLNPSTPLIEASDGDLYGTTEQGGGGYGAVYKLSKNGSGYTVLYLFAGGSPGLNPESPLLEGSDGALYGAAQNGSGFWGTLFMLNKDGSGFTVLHTFWTPGDGKLPSGQLIKATNGALYGTTWGGGVFNVGTVFELSPPQTPDMVAVQMAGSTPQVILGGMGGYNYDLFRSSDLTNWSLLTSFTMAAAGISTNTDNMPTGQAAYYRAAWVP